MADNNYLDQNGVLYLWQKIVAKITNMIANKVDKVDGKGLSTNDYTTAFLIWNAFFVRLTNQII